VSESPQEGSDKNLLYGNGNPGLMSLYHMVEMGLQEASADCVYPHVEADCLYPEGYFQYFGGGIGYHMNKWRMNSEGAWPDSRWPSFSGCVGNRDFIRDLIEMKLSALKNGDKVKWCEPCNREGEYTYLWNERPYIDVRWGGNMTGDRKGDYQQVIPYWGRVDYLQEMVGLK
jgi:hypothetical protein